MTSTYVPPWQTVVDSLTKKSSEWNLFSYARKQSELEIAQKCMRHEILRSYLSEWMELCLSNSPKKSSAESISFRSKGNEEFKEHHDLPSLTLYTDSIRFAPNGSEELALGHANRSAVLFQMKKYKECIKDTEKALSLPYPSRLKPKLLLRQARCYLHLEEWKNCQNVLQLCEKILRESSSGSSTGRSKQEIQLIRMELNEMQQREPNTALAEVSQESLPSLLMGPNPDFPFASAALELRYSHQKGRYVVTTQDVEQGDILFVEKPYAFVVLPEQSKIHCHHCSKASFAPIPCRGCVEALFCDEACEVASHQGYHQWECRGMSLMSAVGIAHLGLRVILTTGVPTKLLDRSHAASKFIQSAEGSFGSLDDSYSTVYSLIPHIGDMSSEDLFQYSATAELLTLFLLDKTDYFGSGEKSLESETEVVIPVCALLLRHIAQLVCNAHAITKIDSDRKSAHLSSGINSVVSETQQRIATAIYPSASMMNHSCDPNIINSFCAEVLIVKASRKIPKGEEVFNCYGPHFQRMGTSERQVALQSQYFFYCTCTACVSSPGESFDPVQERLWALRCVSCSGPLINEAPGREPAGSKVARDSSNSHFMVCDACGVHQPISNLVHDAFSAVSLFRQGSEDLEDGHVQGALSSLNRCRVLQERALYRSNKELTATYDMLAKCHATLGNYSKSEEFLAKILPAVEEQFGVNSVEVANELQKMSDVMLCNIRSMETTPDQDMLNKALKVVERALSILSVHYGSWNRDWQDLDKKRQELNLMSDMATVQGDVKNKMKL